MKIRNSLERDSVLLFLNLRLRSSWSPEPPTHSSFPKVIHTPARGQSLTGAHTGRHSKNRTHSSSSSPLRTMRRSRAIQNHRRPLVTKTYTKIRHAANVNLKKNQQGWWHIFQDTSTTLKAARKNGTSKGRTSAWQFESCVLLRIKLQGDHNNVAVNGQRLQFCKELWKQKKIAPARVLSYPNLTMIFSPILSMKMNSAQQWKSKFCLVHEAVYGMRWNVCVLTCLKIHFRKS